LQLAGDETATNSIGVDASVQTHVARRQAQALSGSSTEFWQKAKQTLDIMYHCNDIISICQ
jgi:hypothetical protein